MIRNDQLHAHPVMEFHVSRRSRDRYRFDESLFTFTGNVIFANFHAARVFAQRINATRDLVSYPEQAVRAGQINALGLLDETLHFIVALYRETVNPQVARQALEFLQARVGSADVDAALGRFADEFPPLAVYRRDMTLDEYLAGDTGGVPHRELVLEELLMLWLTNVNPAADPFQDLFDDTALEKQTAYLPIMAALHEFFETQPKFGPDDENLIDMLRAPALASPHSLTGQLEFIRTRWGGWSGLARLTAWLRKFLYRVLGSLDLIREEEKAVFLGPGPARVYEFASQEYEPERFSPDREWMPRLVLIAKNAYVWLDQLSRTYRRPITRLDEIPDAELETLARRGMTGLWLIGVWERSQASARIKQIMGNPEAVASAYSLHDYGVAADLGGPAAYQNLKERAWRYGIRMASDMVPNHMAIDSRWVVEHPDWFVQLDHSPFPSYSFNGPDLSQDARVGIFLEDHYYSRSDAAVVFKRTDRWTGQERYIYHGNDGTSYPWNDTAQLNYLNPEVREAVIQTILHVARQFPVIRFDAAMTLAKKHYQRLWYPEPGTGGAIASRADHGLTKEQFDAAMPAEFWREVVDRVAAEAPDTLLLAEAFWLLEGYFVRTLGMHRVYNSAFMNMLRDEDNAKYRQVMKNTLEFDPEVLKRYVNFMNNPDERTAIDQFGAGDKYFGIATLMATMPGLPMFGHGQIEGFAEKYGMEYRRAYWDEQPQMHLIERHERELAPLLHKRYLFADVQDFRMYDFFAPDGHVNEDVFAYSNRAGHERSLVIYHNRFATAPGWVRSSVAYSVKTGQGDERKRVQTSLAEGLGLRDAPNCFAIFRDQRSGLEYIRSSQDLFARGLYVQLNAYQCHVFLDWREVLDDEAHSYANLNAYLDGRGVPGIEDALREIFLQPIHSAFKELVNAGQFRWIIDNRAAPPAGMFDEVEAKMVRLLQAAAQFAEADGDAAALARQMREELEAALGLPELTKRFPLPAVPAYAAAARFLRLSLGDDDLVWGTLLNWMCVHAIGKVLHGPDAAAQSRTWIDEWRLGKIMAGALQDLGASAGDAQYAVALIKVLTTHQGWCEDVKPGQARAFRTLQALLADGEVQRFLQVNRHQDVLWFNKESFERLTCWLLLTSGVQVAAEGAAPDETVAERIRAQYDVVRQLRRAKKSSGYQIEKLLEAARKMNT